MQIVSTLAQASDSADIFIWSLVLIVLVVLAFIGVIAIRRWMSSDEPMPQGPGLTLEDLRRLKSEGKLSQEEYEKARGAIVAMTQAAANRPPVKDADGETFPPPPPTT